MAIRQSGTLMTESKELYPCNKRCKHLNNLFLQGQNREMSLSCRGLAWLLVLLLIAEVASDYRDAFEYPFVMPRHPAPSVRTPSIAPAWQQFYPDNYDFSDYSRHITRTDPASRNSAAEQVPSGPYFAQELKTYYHKPADEHKVYQTSWNMIDSEGNEYASLYNRPTLTNHRPASISPVPLLSDHHAFVLDAWQRQQQEHQQLYLQKERPTPKPISKKPARKKNKVRPIHPGMTNVLFFAMTFWLHKAQVERLTWQMLRQITVPGEGYRRIRKTDTS